MLPNFTIPTLEPEFVVQALSETYDWGSIDLGVPKIHRQTQGEGVTIAIIDSGKSNHFEVANNIVDAQNFTTSPTIDDKAGHASFCSGIISAEINNDGIIGVAPKSKLLMAKSIGDGGAGTPVELVKGVKWAIEKGADIISISAGIFFDFKPLHEIIKEAYRQNIIMVAACGNSSNRYPDIAFPARYPEVIGVAAYDQSHKPASFSSRGVNVKFALPGVDIYSTWLDNGFAKMSGTSFATPILSGICALILSKHRNTKDNGTDCGTPLEMLEHLKKYAVDMNDRNATGFGSINTQQMFNLEDN